MPADTAPLTSNQDFRRLWLAGLATFMVRWLEILSFGVFTYQQTGSAFMVAMMTMVRVLPMALFGLPFGVLAARVVKRRGMQGMIGLMLITAVTLAVINANEALEIWHLAVASFINGTAWAADNPLRRALIGEVAGPLRMAQAMAIDVGTSNASRLVGPGLGGFLLATTGIQGVFVLALALYLVALYAATSLREAGRTRVPVALSFRVTVLGGVRAALDSPRLLGAFWVTIVFNLFGWPVLSMIPVIGEDRLGLNSDGIGLLASMDGLGALLGAFCVASALHPDRYGRLYVAGVALFLAMLPAFALSTHPIPAGLALLLCGVGQSGFSVMQATLSYVAAPPDKRSEVMGLMTMCIGTGPIGFLGLGWLAATVPPPIAASLSAATGLLLLALTWRWWRATWRDDASVRRAPDAK